MQWVILEVMWHKGYFGESGITVWISVRIFIDDPFSYTSLSQPVWPWRKLPKSWHQTIYFGDKTNEVSLHVYWMCNQTENLSAFCLEQVEMSKHCLPNECALRKSEWGFKIYNAHITRRQDILVSQEELWLIPLSNLIIYPWKSIAP